MTQAPNIVLILIDDLGWADLTSYGSSFYETPNLDRLARDGMRFTDAYASCPVCSPTRASLMTGRYPARVGITQWIGGHSLGRLCDVPYFNFLPHSERTIATALHEAGYQTWHVGKWHLGAQNWWPDKHGFDVNIGGSGMGRPMSYWSPWRSPTMEDGPVGQHLTDGLTDAAIKLIRQRDTDRPFFLNLWHYAVHTPIQAPEDLTEKYRQKARDMGLNQDEAMEPGEFLPCLHKRHERVMRRRFQSDPAYAAMVEQLDSAIGRLLDELESQGLTNDTLVVFTSDNGGLSTSEGSPTCNAPLAEGKGWMYEGGTRVCQIVRWPGAVAPGSETDEPCTSTDWYPTFLAAAGLPPEPRFHVDGVDLTPLLQGDDFQRGPIFWHYPHYSNQGCTPAAAIRDGDWKLIEFFEDHHVELYNLRDDIGEDHELSKTHPQRAHQMHQRLIQWRHEVEALVPKVNTNYPPEFDGDDIVDPAEV